MFCSGAFPWYLTCLVAACACAASPELRLFEAPASYDVETTVLLNDVARKDKEVGYKIKATLDVAPAWSGGHTQLLELRLHSPQLYLKGKHIHADFLPYGSVWDQHQDSTFYALRNNGLIEEAYLDPSELPDVLNYKKSLISLFQFQASDGEHNETDISGSCLVLYETISNDVFRKIKRRCEYEPGAAVVSARRAARYSLGQGGLRAVHAEELLALGHHQLGLKARAWQRLEARAAAASAAASASASASASADLPAALRALPAELRALPLPMDDADELDPDEEQEPAAAAAAALRELGAAHERAGGGGSAAAALAVLRALPALRRAGPDALAALLARADQHDLAGLCRLLGLAGTRAAHAAAAAALQLHARDPAQPLAHAYLAAFALAAAPDERAVLEVLRLGEEGRAAPVAESALLAAAAAAPRAGEPAARAVRDQLARSLARCQDEACRTVRVRALGNLRRADTAEPLLEQAERGARAEPRAALAAVRALAAAPAAALSFARLDRLAELALDERASLELRAAALDLVARRRAELPAPLARLAYRLHERGPHELRRVLWQRLAALAPHHAQVARLPRMLEPHMRGWDAHAHAGTSSVLVRDSGCGAGGWRALLDSVQVARGGLLRRGAVRLLAEDAAAPGDSADELLAVEVWTRGLEAFGGGGAGEPGAEPAEPEDAGGGLELAVGGARMREISLFDGQVSRSSRSSRGGRSAASRRRLRPRVPCRRRSCWRTCGPARAAPPRRCCARCGRWRSGAARRRCWRARGWRPAGARRWRWRWTRRRRRRCGGARRAASCGCARRRRRRPARRCARRGAAWRRARWPAPSRACASPPTWTSTTPCACACAWRAPTTSTAGTCRCSRSRARGGCACGAGARRGWRCRAARWRWAGPTTPRAARCAPRTRTPPTPITDVRRLLAGSTAAELDVERQSIPRNRCSDPLATLYYFLLFTPKRLYKPP